MKIGLTGGIACGKSSVGAMLVQCGAALIDADQIAREVVLPGEPALGEIVDLFGHEVLQTDGTLNRSALGEIVFHDADKRRQLESIMHPAIRVKMRERIAKHEAQFPDVPIFADVPLLYETGQDKLYDSVVVVYVPRSQQLIRLLNRHPGMTEEQAVNRIEAQMDIELKRQRADWVIDNSGTLEETRSQVETLWERLVRC
ncbi:dephospho-CoA kinase [Paenibacillus sp. GCM10012307]|uniref:Dephospho-CoA kinase n=1 Tax=Paenibacillus roseus TaxID=2798579 RepID=A0A934MT08_9BACL|nr:dephospho-CoA kinase [Paenibacillus roseus]MBJ6363774.1 dephospho-CoA kinase [Paenibacillus roseus]